MENNLQNSFRVPLRAVVTLALFAPLLLFFYFQFVAEAPDFGQLRWDLYVLTVLLLVGPFTAILENRLNLLAVASLGTFLYFVLPKMVLITQLPENALEMSSKTGEAISLFTECWLMLLIVYGSLSVTCNLLIPKKPLTEFDKSKRMNFLPVPQLVWNIAFLTFFGLGFVAFSASPHMRTAAAVLILTTRPPRNYIPLFVVNLLVILLNAYDYINTAFITTAFVSSFLIIFAGVSARSWLSIVMGFFSLLLFNYAQVSKYSYRNVLIMNPDMTFEAKLNLLQFWLVFNVAAGGSGEGPQTEELNPDGTPEEQNLIAHVLFGALTDPNVLTRIHDDSLERIMEVTPSRLPYWGGESLKRIPFILIPRLFWSEKPSRDYMNQFGREYGFISDIDTETSVGFHLLAEGYLNWGNPGAFLFAFCLALLIVFLELLNNVLFQEIRSVATLVTSSLFLGPVDADMLISMAIMMVLCLLFIDRLIFRSYRRSKYATKADPYVDAAAASR